MADGDPKDPARSTAQDGAQHAAAGAGDGVDVTLVRWTLSLTPAERLAVLQGAVDAIAGLRCRLGTH